MSVKLRAPRALKIITEETMSEEKTMPGFMTYKEAALLFTILGEQEAADAIKATCDYFLYGKIPELTGAAAKVFEIERAAIDRGRESYQAKVNGGRAGADKRWRGQEKT